MTKATDKWTNDPNSSFRLVLQDGLKNIVCNSNILAELKRLEGLVGSQQKDNKKDNRNDKLIRHSASCGYGKFRISVVDVVDDNTVFDKNNHHPVDGFYQCIEVNLDSPMVGTTSIMTYELNPGDFQKLADMFNLLAAEERSRSAAKDSAKV